MKNYYEILEISPNASPEIIEKAYKTLVKKYHPDIQPQDKLLWAQIQMKEINEAYTILSNPYSRNQYDLKNNVNEYNSDYSQNYNNLYSDNKNLNRQFSYNSSESDNTNSKTTKSFTGFSFIKMLNLNSYFGLIRNTLYDASKKPEQERKKDLLAISITIIIVLIIVLLFWKVPFLNKLLSF